jgi:hypothetical protein
MRPPLKAGPGPSGRPIPERKGFAATGAFPLTRRAPQRGRGLAGTPPRGQGTLAPVDVLKQAKRGHETPQPGDGRLRCSRLPPRMRTSGGSRPRPPRPLPAPPTDRRGVRLRKPRSLEPLAARKRSPAMHACYPPEARCSRQRRDAMRSISRWIWLSVGARCPKRGLSDVLDVGQQLLVLSPERLCGSHAQPRFLILSQTLSLAQEARPPVITALGRGRRSGNRSRPSRRRRGELGGRCGAAPRRPPVP